MKTLPLLALLTFVTLVTGCGRAQTTGSPVIDSPVELVRVSALSTPKPSPTPAVTAPLAGRPAAAPFAELEVIEASGSLVTARYRAGDLRIALSEAQGRLQVSVVTINGSEADADQRALLAVALFNLAKKTTDQALAAKLQEVAVAL